MLSGCSIDSFFDQSVTGRWERTATSAPILERLTTIEDQRGEYVELSDVTPEDLIPAPKEYRISPGDFINIAMYDLVIRGGVEPVQKQVDTRGVIELPFLGQIAVVGKTAEQAKDLIQEAMKRFVGPNPQATVEVVQQRQQTFTMLGAVGQPGPYFIPTAEYRLLEALTASGQFNDSIEELYVIRQISLSDQLNIHPPTGQPTGPAVTLPDSLPGQPAPTPPAPAPQPGDPKLIDLIDELSKPGDQTPPAQPAPAQPQPAEPPKNPGAPSVMASGASRPARLHRDDPPPVDLVDSSRPAAQPAASPQPGPSTGQGTTWMFLDGKWVPVGRRDVIMPGGEPGAAGSDMVTQRVIRVPLDPLLAGDSKYNIIVRPGDIIRVPPPQLGNIYIAGQVNRPGVYSLPSEGRLTLLRLVDAAGGLGGLGVPERVELTRMVGKNRQATISLDLRAIAEMTQPDIYLKPDDRINVGTNFWAYPVAVLRSGFRATYGFGFVLDRNFDDEVFGYQNFNNGF
ncbi:MAG: polysaccharide biosynthesis/export family protein [Phycisphaerales bacterium]|nr:polysaccharide biosynthesis/export family protein [Phycisphaerales bacterium]